MFRKVIQSRVTPFWTHRSSAQSSSSCYCGVFKRLVLGVPPPSINSHLITSSSFSTSIYHLSPKKNDDKGETEAPENEDVQKKSRLLHTQTEGQDFLPFEDKSRVIQDIFEQQWNPIPYEELDMDKDIQPQLEYNKKRGKTGMFDLEELVEILDYEKALDITVIQIPKEVDWANHMVLCSMRTAKHMYSLATAIRKRYKTKEMKKGEQVPRLEGTEGADDWLAIDLGNIILHIFGLKYREVIDLETLWTVGPEWDDLSNMKDSDLVQLLNMDFSEYIKKKKEIKEAAAELVSKMT